MDYMSPVIESFHKVLFGVDGPTANNKCCSSGSGNDNTCNDDGFDTGNGCTNDGQGNKNSPCNDQGL